MILPPPPKEPKDIPRYLAAIIPIIQQHLTDVEADSITFTELHEAPEKVYEGLTVYADGIDWNPGSGKGLYMYQSGSWSLK